MAERIPIKVNPPLDIEVDGALVADALGLAPATFRQLMESGKITVLCERGTAEDQGLYRATFYHGKRRTRVVLDHLGNVVGDIESVERP